MTITINKNSFMYLIFIIIVGVLGYHTYKFYKQSQEQIVKIEQIEKENGKASIIYYEQEIETLKKENKALYDSIKQHKNEIDYLVKFKYEKKHETGVVKTDTIKEIIHNQDSIVKTYEYSAKTDTISYNLKIGSTEKPQWYSLDFAVSDNFSIVNKKFDNFNKLDINSDSKGEITDVTVLKKKEKTNIFDNISIGPSVTMGYNFAMKEPEFIVGFSITYDIKDLIWKKK